MAILNGQFFAERRKCNCVFCWPTTKCHCLVFLFFQGIELGGHTSIECTKPHRHMVARY